MATVEDLPTAKVTGQFLFVSQDNADAGTSPNAVLVSGYVRFTCSAQPPLLYRSLKVSAVPLVSDAVFDSEGFLIPMIPNQTTPEVIPGSVERGLELLADSPGVSPRGFTWNVTFNLREAITGRVISIPPFNISLSAGTTVDLSEVIPVGMSNGIPTAQGPQGEPGPPTVIAGNVATPANLPSPKTTSIGTGYIVNSDRTLWVLHTTGWKSVGSLGSTGGSSLPEGGTTEDYLRGDGAWAALNKAVVGLGKVDNTSDLEKPVSTATASAITEAVTGLASGVDGQLDEVNTRIDGTNTRIDDMAGAEHTHGVADLSDATTLGTGLLKAANAAAARTLLGAGTSNLTIGTTSNNAKAGNWVPSYNDITGTVPTSALPPLAVVDTSVVASQSAMLALNAQRGDIAIRTDNGRTYILATDAPATLANWKELMAAGQVASVAGQTGTVTLTKADVGLANVDNTSDVNKPVSTAQRTAINAITKSSLGLGNVDNTTDLLKPVSNAQRAAIDVVAARATTLEGRATTLDSKVAAAEAREARTWIAKAKNQLYNTGDTESPMCQIDLVQFVAGRKYRFTVSGLHHATEVEQAVTARVRVGALANYNVVSTDVIGLDATFWTAPVRMSGGSMTIMGIYEPTATANKRVYSTFAKVLGNGGVYMNKPWTLYVEELPNVISITGG